MNFIENQNRSKAEIIENFLAFFKIEDITHLDAQKVKDIKQLLGESI